MTEPNLRFECDLRVAARLSAPQAERWASQIAKEKCFAKTNY